MKKRNGIDVCVGQGQRRGEERRCLCSCLLLSLTTRSEDIPSPAKPLLFALFVSACSRVVEANLEEAAREETPPWKREDDREKGVITPWPRPRPTALPLSALCLCPWPSLGLCLCVCPLKTPPRKHLRRNMVRGFVINKAQAGR